MCVESRTVLAEVSREALSFVAKKFVWMVNTSAYNDCLRWLG